MGGVGFRGPQAPCAAAGEVRPDPFPIGTRALCADLNSPAGLLRILHNGRLLHAIHREQALPQFELSVGVQLGSVRADFDGSIFR